MRVYLCVGSMCIHCLGLFHDKSGDKLCDMGTRNYGYLREGVA
jgi:hypothetical protein